MGKILKDCCKSLIVTLNLMVLLVSLAILATSIYLIVEQYNYQVFGNTDTALWVVWTPFAFSLFLTVLALIGCCVTIDDKKGCIIFFGILQLIFGIVIVVAGAFLLTYTGYMQTIAETQNTATLAPGLYDTQWYLSDYTIGMFDSCCNRLVPAVAPCSSNPSEDYCFFELTYYTQGRDTSSSECTSLLNAANSLNVVLCDGGNNISSLKAFQSTISNYATDYFRPSGIAFCVFGSILLVAFLGSCYIGCCYKPKAKYAKEEVRRDNTGAPLTMA